MSLLNHLDLIRKRVLIEKYFGLADKLHKEEHLVAA